MIESIEFKNFKALRDTILELGPCTILVGPNGSGKTTVLQALEAISGKRSLNFGETVTADLRGDDNATVVIGLKWDAPYAEVNHVYNLARAENLRMELPDLSRQDKRILKAWVNRIRVFSLDASAIAAPVELKKNVELAPNGGALAGVLDQLRDHAPERFEALNEEVARWLPEFDRILFGLDQRNWRTFVLRTREGRHEIPAADVSQGALLALTMLTLAYLPNPPSLIGLEEPDRGIHPYLLRHVQDAIYRLSNPESCGEKRDPVQVIATTHSPYFIDLFKDHPEEIVVANKVGSDVQFRRLTDVPHFGEMLGDASLGEAWYTGFLGGVPSES